MPHALLGLKALPPAPPPPPLLAPLPARVLGAYFLAFDFSMPITSVPLDFNLIYVFNCVPWSGGVLGPDGSFNNAGNGTFYFPEAGAAHVSKAAVQTVRNRGQRVILSIGGSQNGYNFDTRAKSNNLLLSLTSTVPIPTSGEPMGIIAQLGGVDGVDFNNFETVSSTPAEMVYIAQQLKLTYGANFIITSPPGGFNCGGGNETDPNGNVLSAPVTGDPALMAALLAAGCLDYAGGQYYDWNIYKPVGNVARMITEWCSGLANLTAPHVVVGLSANYNFANALTLAECQRELTTILAAHPTIRGVYCWNAQSEFAEGNIWAPAIATQIGATAPAAPPAGSPPPPPPPPPPPAPNLSALQGVNMPGMDFAHPSIRLGPSSAVNIDYGVPRSADVNYLALQGFGRNRYPILWELVQPILVSSPANSSVLAAHGISVAGQCVPRIMAQILDVLDSHAAAGSKVLLDLHNYCRYRDFKYQAGGSVNGLSTATGYAPWTTGGTAQIQDKIFALVAGAATLTQTDFNGFWTNFINYVEAGTGRTVKQHAGLAGYGLMNEPNTMPAAGSNVDGSIPQDLTIWPIFAQSAITTIRALDSTTPIYVGGNNWDQGWDGSPGGTYAGSNPGFPLTGSNLIYESHFYLDSRSSGARFDWTVESTQPFSVGESLSHGVTTSTGTIRAQYALDFKNTGQNMVVSEIGMPDGNVNWQTGMQATSDLMFSNGIGMMLWAGGNFWNLQDWQLNCVPNFKQGKTFRPQSFGVLLKSASAELYDIFADADTQWGPAGTLCTITLHTRGYSASSRTVTLTKTTGTGTLGTTSLTIPAGANQSITTTYVTAGTEEAIITFTGQTVAPANLHFYSMDPASYVATDATIAARACLAKYKALEWVANNAYTDYLNGSPAVSGNTPRAIWNSGFGENYYNAHGMKLWWSQQYDSYTLPTASLDSAGHKVISFTGNIGFWSHKVRVDAFGPNTEPSPVHVLPYGSNDNHFHIVGVSIPNAVTSGAVFAVNDEQGTARTEIDIANGHAKISQCDSLGVVSQVTAPAALTLNAFHTISAKFAPSSQHLRVDGAEVASMAAGTQNVPFTSMEIGWIFNNFFPFTGFVGNFYGAITGKGFPTDAEALLMENYLTALTTGASGGGGGGGGGGTDFPAGVAGLSGWFDPQTLFTLHASSVSGGSVIGAGGIVGQVSSRPAGTSTLSVPDANRFFLQQDGGGFYYLADPIGNCDINGGSTTAFFFCAAIKLGSGVGAGVNVVWSDSAGNPTGYDITYSSFVDRMVFSSGNGTSRTQIIDTSVLNGSAGVPFVLTCWDDGSNLNIQVNNGTINSVARATVSAGGVPAIWELDAFNTNAMSGNLYGMVWAKNNALSAPNRAGIKTFLGSRCGVAL